ncbi:MAG: NADH-quinone oxidoreductase subunit M [Pseudomonadales bacterium]|nr:NADH-quinone oxidoreductase subunit M [Pseudomonadales bacterium]
MVLAWLILIPLIGGLLAWPAERFGAAAPRWIALLSMLLVLGIAASLWPLGHYGQGLATGGEPWQLELQVPWIPRFGIDFHLAIDGLSLSMVILTALIGVLAVGCSWRETGGRVGLFQLNLLWVLAGVLGVFLAIDLFLFFFFWEMMLVPTFFLIALWGHRGSRRERGIAAATKFFIYTQISGLLLLLAIIGLVYAHHELTGQLTFDYDALRTTSLPDGLEYLLMLGFLAAFVVKLPVVPFHSWLPDAHAEAPTAGSVDLAGLLLKTAAYGLLRFSLPLFPEASQQIAPLMMALGLVSIVYGALLAFAQHDLKRLIAYTSISHMGFVVIGIYAGSIEALQGVVVQMVAHALSAAGLFILAGSLYGRLGTRDLREMGGLWSKLPILPGVSLFFAAATLGMPGTGNFIGEFLILMGSYPAAPLLTALATGGLVLASVYALTLIHRVYYGPEGPRPVVAAVSPREVAMFAILIALSVWVGLHPQLVMDTSADTIHRVRDLYLFAAPATGVQAP